MGFGVGFSVVSVVLLSRRFTGTHGLVVKGFLVVVLLVVGDGGLLVTSGFVEGIGLGDSFFFGVVIVVFAIGVQVVIAIGGRFVV